MNLWPLLGLGLLLLALGFVVGYVHGYEAFTLSQLREENGRKSEER